MADGGGPIAQSWQAGARLVAWPWFPYPAELPVLLHRMGLNSTERLAADLVAQYQWGLDEAGARIGTVLTVRTLQEFAGQASKTGASRALAQLIAWRVFGSTPIEGVVGGRYLYLRPPGEWLHGAPRIDWELHSANGRGQPSPGVEVPAATMWRNPRLIAAPARVAVALVDNSGGGSLAADTPAVSASRARSTPSGKEKEDHEITNRIARPMGTTSAAPVARRSVEALYVTPKGKNWRDGLGLTDAAYNFLEAARKRGPDLWCLVGPEPKDVAPEAVALAKCFFERRFDGVKTETALRDALAHAFRHREQSRREREAGRVLDRREARAGALARAHALLEGVAAPDRIGAEALLADVRRTHDQVAAGSDEHELLEALCDAADEELAEAEANREELELEAERERASVAAAEVTARAAGCRALSEQLGEAVAALTGRVAALKAAVPPTAKASKKEAFRKVMAALEALSEGRAALEDALGAQRHLRDTLAAVHELARAGSPTVHEVELVGRGLDEATARARALVDARGGGRLTTVATAAASAIESAAAGQDARYSSISTAMPARQNLATPCIGAEMQVFASATPWRPRTALEPEATESTCRSSDPASRQSR